MEKHVTNFECKGELKEAAAKALNACHEFYKIRQKICGSAGVVWVDSLQGELMIFTRSEYRRQLMENIDNVNNEIYSLAEETSGL